jgi:hypothetical protein
MELPEQSLTRSQILQKKINEVLYPEKLDRLKIGCQIICKYNGLVTLSQNAERYKKTEFFYCYGFDSEIGVGRGCKGNELHHILGKPIEFSDLNLFINKSDSLTISYLHFNSNTSKFEVTIRFYYNGWKTLNIQWNCLQDFNNQDESVFKCLDELFDYFFTTI